MKSKPKAPAKKAFRKSARLRAQDSEYRVPANESEEIVLAIRRGKIDALVMAGADGDQVLMLHHAEHPYRVLVETINDGVATLDRSGIVLYANNRMAAILRAPVESLIGSSLQDHVPEADRKAVQALVADGLTNSSQGEITLEDAEGRHRLVRLALNPVKNSVPQSVCVVATELTELAEANQALRTNEESLRQLSSRLLRLQDEERRRIARDLHDITGPKLAVQSITLSQLLSNKKSTLDADSRRLLLECNTLTKEIGDDIRTLSYLLHPPLLDELGLSSAVKWYAEGVERRSGIKVKVDIPTGLVRLKPDVEVALFRVIQESLTNVHRYSGSQRAYVRVIVTYDEIKVQIGDFGKGMRYGSINNKTGQVAPVGVGIQGMKERIRQLNGTLEIASQANKGTLVTATIPLAGSRAADSAESDSEFESESSAKSTWHSTSDRSSSSSDNAAARDSGAQAASPWQIFIADDHDMMRQGIRSILQTASGLEVCGEAAGGQDAINKISALKPDLVILDVYLPELNGLAAIRQILRNRPETKILVFSMDDSNDTQKEARSAGAHGFLPKDTSPDEFLQVVRRILEETASVAAANR